MIFFAFLGSLLGVVTGLTPGLHVNAVSLILVSAQGSLLALVSVLLAWADVSALEVGVLLGSIIVGIVSTHTFVGLPLKAPTSMPLRLRTGSA